LRRGEPKVVEVEISANCHATEDEDKVLSALKNLVSPNIRSAIHVEELSFTGYYGNPIKRFVIKIRGEEAEEVARYVLSSLGDVDREILLSTFESRYDRRSSKLYLRVNKQEAYLGRLRLYDGSDAIRVVVSFAHGKDVPTVKHYITSKILAEASE